MQCPNCFAQTKDGAKFCHRCGTPLTQAAAPAVPNAAPSAAPSSQSNWQAQPSAQNSWQTQPTPSMPQAQPNNPYPPNVNNPYPTNAPYQAANKGINNATLKWVFVGISVVLMLLLTFVPWIGIPDEYASTVQQYADSFEFELGATSFTLLSAGLSINNNVVPSLRELAQLFIEFGGDTTELNQMISQIQQVSTILIAVWGVNMAALAFAIFADVTGRRGTKWVYPLLALTCIAVIAVLYISLTSIAESVGAETGEMMNATMALLKPGLWLSLVGSIAASVGRFVVS